ncbi:MAG: tRNA pseudouridine(38-40) synthase TruA [Planctomycetes bacterium]|nr:tRNA pseudouridine(38-40) synthase TruA [Planctomycetota bacterium]
MPTYLLTIAYDGARCHGWQLQHNGITIQEELERALAAIDLPGVRVEGAGRTDAGVHAIAQCAHVVLPRPFEPERLLMAMNTHLPPDIAVQAVREVPAGFHARFCARGKRYVYRCRCSRVRPAIGRHLYHWVRREVDLDAMRAAAAHLVGRHDFAAFASNPGRKLVRGTVRTLHHAHLIRRAEGFDFAVQGSGFLYNQVRNMVGSLLEVGYGNRSPDWLREVRDARDRRRGGPTAPAAGLYLLRVLYAPDLSPGPEPGADDDV